MPQVAGFYSKSEIHPPVPRILESFPEVEFQRGKHPGQLGQLVDRLLDKKLRQEGGRYKVMLLSAPDFGEAIELRELIANDKKSSTGKKTAYTMRHRYVAIGALKKAKTTADLDGE